MIRCAQCEASFSSVFGGLSDQPCSKTAAEAIARIAAVKPQRNRAACLQH